MENLLSFFKMMSDETRFRIVMLLTKQAHCVCELTEILGLSQPKISKHLSKLKDLGFVETTRNAQFIYYQLVLDDACITTFIKALEAQIDDYPVLKADAIKQPTCAISQNIKTL